jgi:hypothetical protein
LGDLSIVKGVFPLKGEGFNTVFKAGVKVPHWAREEIIHSLSRRGESCIVHVRTEEGIIEKLLFMTSRK